MADLPSGGDTMRRLEATILKELGVDPNKVTTNTLQIKPIGTNGFIVSWEGGTFVDTFEMQRIMSKAERAARSD